MIMLIELGKRNSAPLLYIQTKNCFDEAFIESFQIEIHPRCY